MSDNKNIKEIRVIPVFDFGDKVAHIVDLELEGVVCDYCLIPGNHIRYGIRWSNGNYDYHYDFELIPPVIGN